MCDQYTTWDATRASHDHTPGTRYEHPPSASNKMGRRAHHQQKCTECMLRVVQRGCMSSRAYQERLAMAGE